MNQFMHFMNFYLSLKLSKSIDELKEKYLIIMDDEDLFKIQYDMLTDIYNYHKTRLA